MRYGGKYGRCYNHRMKSQYIKRTYRIKPEQDRKVKKIARKAASESAVIREMIEAKSV